MKVHINTVVSVVLTEDGMRLYRESRTGSVYVPPPDEGTPANPLRCPLWDLMDRFGPAVRIGRTAPFVGGDVEISDLELWHVCERDRPAAWRARIACDLLIDAGFPDEADLFRRLVRRAFPGLDQEKR